MKNVKAKGLVARPHTDSEDTKLQDKTHIYTRNPSFFKKKFQLGQSTTNIPKNIPVIFYENSNINIKIIQV